MDKIILNAERFDLTGKDINRITDGKTEIIQYEQLENISNLEEILNRFGAVVILYTTRKNFGHWVCLFRKNNNVLKELEFFDPYGLKVDQELNISNAMHLREHQGIVTPHLTSLINKGGYNVTSNTQQLQKFLDHVNTCGRHVSMRIRFRDTSLKQYIKLMTTNKYYDADMWVSALTLLV